MLIMGSASEGFTIRLILLAATTHRRSAGLRTVNASSGDVRAQPENVARVALALLNVSKDPNTTALSVS
ncbi:hypothetical protein [Amycolatopsis sp. FDAARGOS 1241]|uniref:hypothetical protein n=1 Tax=Amycolatopsis sp. FDAARGOS 1241 TaxID=2778070 RepID=UPI0019504B70|nr:hypothetical protein [Amycolatopsis sp. FDAARGOS 1241]QRP42823.1 hypothetical protein I6J71_25500 [Amycolatopsis sp. FDAARGOS 1241]